LDGTSNEFLKAIVAAGLIAAIDVSVRCDITAAVATFRRSRSLQKWADALQNEPSTV